MKLKMRMTELRRQLTTGTLEEAQPQFAMVLSWVLNFMLGLLLASVPLLGGCGPFGVAAAAQAGAGLPGLMCAAGAALGYLAAFGFPQGVQYVAAVVLVFAAGYAMQEIRWKRRSFLIMPLLAAAFTLLTCYLGSYTLEMGENYFLTMAAQTILAFGCTWFFREALSREERMTEAAELRHGISLVILLSCLLMALSRAVLLDTLSLGRVISILLTLIAAGQGGALSGAAAGLVLGLAMDLSCGYTAFYSMAYAASALAAGLFSRHGRLSFLLSYLLCGVLAVICSAASGIRLELLYENFCASVIYLLLPSGTLTLLGSFLKSAQTSTGETGLRRYTAHRIRRMADAFSDLYTTVDAALSAPVNDEDLSTLFDRASEQVCSHCKNKSTCWNSNYQDTLAAFNDVTELIHSRGILRKEDIAPHFISQCLRPDELVGAVNGELRGRLYRRRFQARLNENRAAAYEQYLGLSEILSGVSEELENAYGPDSLAQRRISRYLNSIDLEADLSVFRDRSGRLHILLESPKLKRMLREPGYLDRLSEAVGVRLCRPIGSDEQAEGRITLLEAEPLTISVGVASMKKTGESVSGDRGTYFKTEQGMLCIMLSDGMGSGELAARESVAAIRILERFLRAGVEPAQAMKLLNSVMLLKNTDEWGFATVDLLCVDLFTGEASFYKYGAAPSYVRAGRQIRRVRSESLAAGLQGGKNGLPDHVKMHLHPGNLAIIASDGILAETDDAWIRKLLGDSGTEDMKELAREVLETAVRQYGSSDDMTVLAVRVEKRD